MGDEKQTSVILLPRLLVALGVGDSVTRQNLRRRRIYPDRRDRTCRAEIRLQVRWNFSRVYQSSPHGQLEADGVVIDKGARFGRALCCSSDPASVALVERVAAKCRDPSRWRLAHSDASRLSRLSDWA
jgi:hypothetical protein